MSEYDEVECCYCEELVVRCEATFSKELDDWLCRDCEDEINERDGKGKGRWI